MPQLANIEWTKTGTEYFAKKEIVLEGGFFIDQDRMLRAFSNCTWRPFIPGESVAFCPGAAINAIVKDLRGEAARYAISHELAPYGLYGVEFEYMNAVVRSYWLDDGCACICIASEPYYIEIEGTYK